MSETPVILEGIENEQTSLSLDSTVQGAGRVMGRMEAKGKRDETGAWTRLPKVTQESVSRRQRWDGQTRSQQLISFPIVGPAKMFARRASSASEPPLPLAIC